MHEHDIGIQIRTLPNLIHRRVESLPMRQYADKVTGVHSWIMGYIYDNSDRELFQKDLEKEFQMRRSTATVILQLMEKNGMIRREKVDYDARLKKIVLTDKALDLHKQIDREIKLFEKQMCKGITQEEMQAFWNVTEKIKQNLNGGTHD